MCDVDEMSLLEIGNMLNECGESGSGYETYYKVPNVDFENGMCPLSTDKNVLQMCNALPSNRIIYVYIVSDVQATQEYKPSQYDLEFIDDLSNTAFEKEQLEQLLELEGIYRDFNDDLHDHEVIPQRDISNAEEVEDHSDFVSFHGDSSNMDSIDDNVTAFKNGDFKVTNYGQCDFDVSTLTGCIGEYQHKEGLDSDFSDYAGSDEERMAANSTDEEETMYPVFNEETDLGDPQFELGMLFCSANSFRTAVRKHALVQRRPLKQKRNFGARVQFVCLGSGCSWKIYASKMKNIPTYQVKTLMPTHSCAPTFDQKQMSSTFLAKHYENDIRMNPTWPLAAFQKKIIND